MLASDAPVEVFEEIDSTLLEARRRAERGETRPVWLVAKRQSAGRGRRGRAWVSHEGNLLATYLGATTQKPQDIALLGLATGVAIAEAIDACLGAARAQVKWPNDVLIDGAKAAGILIDSGATAGATWFALGFGVNLVEAPEGLDQKTACLAEALSAPAPDPLLFLSDVRDRLAHWNVSLDQHGFAELREAWLSRAYGLGAAAVVHSGESKIAGRIVGLLPSGELELETASGLQRIAAGEIVISQLSEA